MPWEDTVITISNFALLLALAPLFFSVVFNVRSVEASIAFTGSITAFFLALIGIATISLGAPVGGSAALVTASVWAVIAGVSLAKRKKNK